MNFPKISLFYKKLNAFKISVSFFLWYMKGTHAIRLTFLVKPHHASALLNRLENELLVVTMLYI